jgi:hypothetical protein
MDELTRIVRDDLGKLRIAGVKPTIGDIRCITFGHLSRMAVWLLRPTWNPNLTTAEKLILVAQAISNLGPYQIVIDTLSSSSEDRLGPPVGALPLFKDDKDERDAVAF